MRSLSPVSALDIEPPVLDDGDATRRAFDALPSDTTNSHYTQKVGEMVFSISIFVLGKVFPFLFALCYSWKSPIPYQTTNDGQVLLELDLNYKLVSKETIPDWLAIVLCIVVPLMIFCIFGRLRRRGNGPKGDVHASLCFYFVTVGTSWFLTDMIKVYTSFPRPNFYAMCQFDTETLQCASDSQHYLSESRLSFPSGHASLAFSSMTALTLFLLGKVSIHRNISTKAISFKTRLLYFVSFSPMLLAWFVAASRVHDYWHHPADIVAGALIGSGCALCFHGMW